MFDVIPPSEYHTQADMGRCTTGGRQFSRCELSVAGQTQVSPTQHILRPLHAPRGLRLQDRDKQKLLLCKYKTKQSRCPAQEEKRVLIFLTETFPLKICALLCTTFFQEQITEKLC